MHLFIISFTELKVMFVVEEDVGVVLKARAAKRKHFTGGFNTVIRM